MQGEQSVIVANEDFNNPFQLEKFVKARPAMPAAIKCKYPTWGLIGINDRKTWPLR